MTRLATCLLLIAVATVALAQEATPAKKTPKPPAGRLPAHYSEIVTPEQKAKIYSVQAKFKEQLDPLTEKVKAIQAARDAEIEALLSPEQKDKLAKAKADAAAKRTAAAEAAKKAEEAAKVATPVKAVEATPVKAPVPPPTIIPPAKPVTTAPVAK